LPVRPDELDVDGAEAIGHGNNQPVVISLDIENHAATLENARTAELLLYFCRAFSIGFLGLIDPRQKRLLGIWALLPVGFQMADGDYSHGSMIVPAWDQRQIARFCTNAARAPHLTVVHWSWSHQNPKTQT
jgi:hypothetical protein